MPFFETAKIEIYQDFLVSGPYFKQTVINLTRSIQALHFQDQTVWDSNSAIHCNTAT